jgi:hypothetical protein
MGRNLLGRGAAVGPKEGVGEQRMVLKRGSSLCVLRDVWFVMDHSLSSMWGGVCQPISSSLLISSSHMIAFLSLSVWVLAHSVGV